MEYNAQQLAVITAPLGPMAIIAGPGTGKTATLAARIIYLMEQYHLTPDQIVAISFTRKAAAELKKRLGQPQLLTTTIHGLALMILRQHESTYSVTEEKLDQFIPDCVTRLKQYPKLLSAVQQRWQYICVDEFQDVDSAQAEFIALIAAAHQQLCVVGDPDQSIYGFRGARLDVLLQFCERYPSAQQYFLSDNYRSQAHIVTAASAFIRHNSERIDHTLVARRSAQQPIIIFRAGSAYREAKEVVSLIQQYTGASDHLALNQGQVARHLSNYSFGDIAIIYRLNTVGDAVENVLKETGLPYHRIGAVGIFEPAPVRDYLEQLPLQSLVSTQTLAQQLPAVLLADQYVDFRTVVASWDDLPAAAARSALLEYALIARPEDDWQPGRNAITVLTAHAAKGLEFSLVFVIGVEEQIFPYTMKADSDIAEERRLFYVAMTRAQDVLYVSSAKQRTIFGQTGPRAPSQFVTELPESAITTHILQSKSPRPKQSKLF